MSEHFWLKQLAYEGVCVLGVLHALLVCNG